MTRTRRDNRRKHYSARHDAATGHRKRTEALIDWAKAIVVGLPKDRREGGYEALRDCIESLEKMDHVDD